MKLTCVYDEGAVVNTSLIGAKGFSVLAENDGKKVLFDTGLRDRYLAHNMEFLEIDPAELDALVVSQRHPDNCRAINAVLDARETPLTVHTPKGLYGGKRGILPGSVGLSEESREKAVLRDIDGWTEVVPKIWISPPVAYDDGYSESFLVLEGRKLIIVSGRGHGGPGPMLSSVRSRFGRDAGAFVGAVFLEKKGKPLAGVYASEFEAAGCTDLRLNHCVGRDGMTNLRAILGLHGVSDFYVGTTAEFRTNR